MVISEKQAMQLMLIAREAIVLSEFKNEWYGEWSDMVAALLDKIYSQQSEELKEIE